MEFGCGLGINSVAIAPYCTKVVGVDTSKGLLRLARSLARGVRNAKFLWYDGGRFPFGSETFNFVFSVGVFERIPKSSVQYYLAEVHRVLKTDGKAFLYFLSNRATDTEFTQRLGKDSYFYYADTEAYSAVCHAGMQVVRVLYWPSAVIVIGRKTE
jgi:cyclopropane fatty-acyl-phospholipid synthase-like methyltransferase